MQTPQTWKLGVGNGELRRDAWLNHLAAEVAADIAAAGDVEDIGLCFPGVVDSTGAIWRENTIWGKTPTDLTSAQLAAALGRPVKVLNDLSAAAVRYGRASEIPATRTVLVVSVSSGIGAKLFDRRHQEVVLEPRGRNGEIGLAVIDESSDAVVSATGLKGILGNYSSGYSFAGLLRDAAKHAPAEYGTSALYRRLKVAARDLDRVDRPIINEAAVQCIHDDDQFCIEALNISVRHLARVLYTIILFSAPEAVVITGGFADAIGDKYIYALRTAVSSLTQIVYSREEIELMIIPGARDGLDNLAGIANWVELGA